MTVNEIYELLHYITKKNVSGKTYKPDEYNRALEYATISLYDKEYAKYEETQKATDTLKRFRKRIIAYQCTNGKVLFSDISDYAHFSSMSYMGNAIEAIGDDEYVERKNSVILKPTVKNPVGVFYGDFIQLYPELPYVDIYYLRKPINAVYDYYRNADDIQIYLAPGASHTLTAGETGSAGQTSGTVNSLSVELDFNEVDHIKMVNELLEHLGLHQFRADVTQYAKAIQTEQIETRE